MSKLTENYVDPFELDLVFKARYITDSKHYFEYLLAQDKRDIPEKKASAKNSFIIGMSVVVGVTALCSLYAPSRNLLFYGLMFVLGFGVLINFLLNGVFNKGSEKFIRKLEAQGQRQGKNVDIHMNLEIYKDEIYLNMGAAKFYIRPQDIEEWYETENLLVFRIRQLRSTPCADLEKVYIPKNVLGDKITEVEDALSRMIQLGEKVLAKMGAKKSK